MKLNWAERMAVNTIQANQIEARRVQVAHLRLRGQPERAIAVQLGVSLGTIASDVKELDRRWRAAAAVTVDEHKARQFAEHQAVRAEAWTRTPLDLDVIVRSLGVEAKLLGTEAPAKSDVTSGGKPFEAPAAVVYLPRVSEEPTGA